MCRQRQRGGWCTNKPRNVREGQQPIRSRGEKDGTDSEGTSPAEDILILDFRPPELWSNMFLLSEPPNVQSFVWVAQKTHTAIPHVSYAATAVTPFLLEPPPGSPGMIHHGQQLRTRGLAKWCDLSDSPQLPSTGTGSHSQVGGFWDHAPNPLAVLPLLILDVASFTPQRGASPRSN